MSDTHLHREDDLAHLRRVVSLVTARPVRRRLTNLVDQLVHEARWDSVDEISASRELASARAEAEAARATAEAAARQLVEARRELGRTRGERDAALARLAELRDAARNGLADELVEVCVRVETEHPTDPPLLALRQAARLVRAVRAA